MTNRFDNNNDGDQNVGQGEGAIGKQENATQEVCGDSNIISDTGNVTVNGVPPELLAKYAEELGQTKELINTFLGTLLKEKVPPDQWAAKLREIAATQEVRRDNNIISDTGNVTGNQNLLPLKPRTVVLIAVLLAAVFASWYSFGLVSSSPMMNSKSFPSGNNFDVNPDVSPDQLPKYTEELDTSKQLINSSFITLLKAKVSRDQWDSKMREIVSAYKDLLGQLATVQSEDPEVQQLKKEAGQAIEAGKYDKAEELLNQAEVRDLAAIEELEQTAKQRRIFAAATNAELAKLQRVQLRYAKAAEYWQKAAALLPEDEKKDRGFYLGEAGYDLDRIARYSEALSLYKQSLVIYKEIDDRENEGTMLNNISQIYDARGDYVTALKYLEQSLDIHREVGNRAMEGTTLNNISQIYDAQGDYITALKYLEQSLIISRKIGDRNQESTILNNISQIYKVRGENDQDLTYYREQSRAIDREVGNRSGEGTSMNNAKGGDDTVLKYLEQSLVIDRAREAATLSNIAEIYHAKGDYATALSLFEQSLDISRKINNQDKRAMEGTILNYLVKTAYAKGKDATALKYLGQLLTLYQENGDRVRETLTSWSIGLIYIKQGDLAKAERYISRAVEIVEKASSKVVESDLKALEEVRATSEELRAALQGR